MFEIFFLFLTLLGNYAFIWLSLALIVAIQQKNRAKNIVLIVVSAIAFSFLATSALKLLFRIPRPSYLILDTKYCPVDYSFPSGHAATSFAAALILGYFDPKRRWFYLILASLISYSRLYLNCHHVVDVVAGAVLGVIISLFVLKISANQAEPVAKKKQAR